LHGIALDRFAKDLKELQWHSLATSPVNQ